jgi:hypothetical protein
MILAIKTKAMIHEAVATIFEISKKYCVIDKVVA